MLSYAAQQRFSIFTKCVLFIAKISCIIFVQKQHSNVYISNSSHAWCTVQHNGYIFKLVGLKFKSNPFSLHFNIFNFEKLKCHGDHVKLGRVFLTFRDVFVFQLLCTTCDKGVAHFLSRYNQAESDIFFLASWLCLF